MIANNRLRENVSAQKNSVISNRSMTVALTRFLLSNVCRRFISKTIHNSIY